MALGQKSRTLAEKTQEFDKILSEYEVDASAQMKTFRMHCSFAYYFHYQALKREVNQANAELTRLKQHINILEEREGNLRQELSQNQQPPNQEKSQDGQNQKPLVNRSQKYQFKAHWETASQEEWLIFIPKDDCIFVKARNLFMPWHIIFFFFFRFACLFLVRFDSILIIFTVI